MDEYNTLIICLTIICIFLLGIIIQKKNRENFQSTCGYTPDTSDSEADCLIKCFTYAKDKAESDAEKEDCRDPGQDTGCIKKCKQEIKNICEIPNNTPDSEPFTQCIINPYMDIDGNTIQQCIDNCENQTRNCIGCKDFHFINQFDGLVAKGTYTNDFDHYINRCSPEASKQQFCSPCVKACKDCSDTNSCRWLAQTDHTQHKEFLAEPLLIGAIPGDKSVTIVWDEKRKDVSGYLIFVYKKSDINVNEENVQQTPLTMKTLQKTDVKFGVNNQTITGLTNGVTYSVTVNKISTNIESISGEKIVKSSNTIDIVPSSVTLIDFSKLKNTGAKQTELLPKSLMDTLKGKTFDISI